MRYFIEIAYKGTNYNGWQVQPNAITVQQKVNEAVSIVLRHDVQTLGSGRTDTGVHARSQFAHFDSDVEITTYGYLLRINGILPKDIKVVSIFKATDNEAHARFSAVSRSYRYEVCLKQNPFLYELCTFLKRKPNVELMNQAVKYLLQHKDFETFSKVSESQEHHFCDITFAQWTIIEDNMLRFDITGNRFLRGMVRLIVGTLLEVGNGKITPQEFESILISKNRKLASGAVPSQGLYLQKVIYPEGMLVEV